MFNSFFFSLAARDNRKSESNDNSPSYSPVGPSALENNEDSIPRGLRSKLRISDASMPHITQSYNNARFC